MIRILQINIGEGRAAHDLMLATAAQMEVDILAVTEPNKAISQHLDRWYLDSGSRAALAVLGNLSIDKVGPQVPDFQWVEIKNIRFYSCYLSPNRVIGEYNDFLDRLEESIRRATVPVVVTGDFNAHSPIWGSPDEDARGSLLADMIAANSLCVCNKGNEPTFVRGNSRTHIDITMASENMVSHVKDWTVLDEESLSLHRYITYSIECRGKRTIQQQMKRAGKRKR